MEDRSSRERRGIQEDGPRGLAKVARDVIGDDVREIADFWLKVMQDPQNPLRLRLDGSKLLAEHGWGKPAPVDLVTPASTSKDGPSQDGHKVAGAAEKFFAELDRLAGLGGRSGR